MYSRFYRLAFDYMARWQPCPENEAAWCAAAKEIAEVSAKGGNHPFLNDMLIAVYTELERQWKAMHRKEGEQEQCG